MQKIELNKICALVLGGHVNGYSIIKELFEQGIREIALFDPGKSIASCSNKVKYHSIIDKKSKTLLAEIKKLKYHYDFIIIFPTDDQHIRSLVDIFDEICNFCYLPFNQKNFIETSNKYYQYKICEDIGVGYPKTFNIISISDLDFVNQIKFPIIIKPSNNNLNLELFRVLYFEDKLKFNLSKDLLIEYLNKGIQFILSEYIPGDDSNIYAYTCFRSQNKMILNEWVGKKLSQRPIRFGNFSSSSSTFNKEVYQKGRLLVDALNAFGIVEPEFKYDYRDKNFKLMEVNFRSHMWNRTGNICGVKLFETQYNYAVGRKIIRYKQDQNKNYHFVLMLHEIQNLISEKNYWRVFVNNIWGGDKLFWAIFEWRDMKPFFYSLKLLFKIIFIKCLRRLGLH